MNIFLTGKPGSGKTSLIKEILKELDGDACGFFTPEIRKGGERKGFKLEDIDTDKEGILASVDVDDGPSVSKYKVNMEDLDDFSKRLMERIEGKDIIVIDEIGVMELYSDSFKEALEKAIQSDKVLIASLHRKLIDDYRGRGKIIWVTKKSRRDLKDKILEVINYTRAEE